MPILSWNFPIFIEKGFLGRVAMEISESFEIWTAAYFVYFLSDSYIVCRSKT
jgi:hypothetical protein